MSVYKLGVPAGTAAANAVAQLDIQFDGEIYGCSISAVPDLDAADDSFAIEVSFLSIQSLGTNDSRGSIYIARQRLSLMTAEAGALGVNALAMGLKVPVTAGERMYLHTSGTTCAADCFIYVEDRASPRLRRRR